jgi:PilZ domain
MLFAEVLSEARTWAAANLPIAVGGCVALAVLMFLIVNTGLRRKGPAPLDPAKLAAAKVAATKPPPGERELNWDTPEQSYADRRGSVRREGQPVRVILTAAAFRNGVADGYVIDRSTGGLKIAAQVAVATGSTVQVRAVDAPDTIGFITVIVRSCRKAEDHYEFGCEFEKTPPWNVLLLFG